MGNFTVTAPATTEVRRAAWIADERSIDLYGLGVRLDVAAFGNEHVSSGTLVNVTTNADGITVAVPAVTGQPAYLLREDYVHGVLTGSSDTAQLVVGGVIYANKLPAALTADQKDDLGGNFTFIQGNF